MGEIPKSDEMINTYLSTCPFSIDELASSTESALRVLRPWFKQKHANPALQRVSCQVGSYVEALNHSIVAAFHGFVFAGQALALACLLKLDEGSDSDREQYVLDMGQIARKGHANAVSATAGFRKVRATLGKAIAEAELAAVKNPSSSSTAELEATKNKLHALEEGIDVLERFSESVQKYVDWWNFMAMQNGGMKDRALSFDYNSLRVKSVVIQWEAIKKDYSIYTAKIWALQDDHPDLLRRDSTVTDNAIDSACSLFITNDTTTGDFKEYKEAMSTFDTFLHRLPQLIRNTFRRGTQVGRTLVVP